MATNDLKQRVFERIQTRFSERVLGTPKKSFVSKVVGKAKQIASAVVEPVRERFQAHKEAIRQRSVQPLKESFSKQAESMFPDFEKDTPEQIVEKNLSLVTGSVGGPKPKGKLKVNTFEGKEVFLDAPKKPILNTARLNVNQQGQAKLDAIGEAVRRNIQAVRGKPVTNEEVLEAAKRSQILTKATSREATVKSEAALLRTRQNLTALAEGKGVSSDFINQLRVVAAEATRRGRELQALKIGADATIDSVKTKMVRDLLDLGIDADDIVKAAKNIDFNNAKQATAFYRQFVKPKFSELIDEARYINLLSSPRTHIVNAFSNVLQGSVLNPATKLASGVVDLVASKLTGKAREAYISEVPAYYRGTINAIGDATRSFIKAIRGEKTIDRPDLFEVPTGNKLLSPFQFVPRLLDGADIFFRTLIKGGEREALALKYGKQGKELAWDLIDQAADEKSLYWVFRKALDPSNASGQGTLLSKIDGITNAAYALRKVPGVKWFIPFIQTPMNILKQGIEFSPVGLATLPGAANKVEQLSKALVGSTVLAGAGYAALQGGVTWAVPKNAKEREAFYAAGRQPYSIKVGDNWISYSKLGPLAYPIAMAAAIQWHVNENPENVTDSDMAKASDVLFGMAEFFSDQSYMQGLGDFLDVIQGDKTAVSRIASNAPSQLIPLSSLQRWVAQMIDPVYRKKDNTLSVEAIISNLKAGIPGLSDDLEPYTNPFGFPSKRQSPVLNAVSPINVTEEQPLFEGQLQSIRAERRADQYGKQFDQMKEKIRNDLRQRLFPN